MAERSGGGANNSFPSPKRLEGGLIRECSTGLSVYCIILLIIVLSLWYLLE